ncbi:MAG: cytidylate kinase-like family protein [Fibrobacterales bacterium]
MKKEFIDYLLRRQKFDEHMNVKPVITISRECGCPSKLVAEKLTAALEARNPDGKYGVQWRWVDKQIIEDTAKKLELDPVFVESVAKAKSGGLSDILTSFSPLPVSDMKIRNTIAEVLHGVADEGHVIIVGRGGVTLLQDHLNAIHIRLQAPYNWRVDITRETFSISEEDAKKKVKEIDEQRMHLRDFFEGKKSDRSIFDLVFNCKTLSPDEIVAMVVSLLDERKLL